MIKHLPLWINLLIPLVLWSFLYTFSLSDPAWNFAADINEYHNLGGVYGAWFSDILFSIFGITAWLIPPSAISALQALLVRYPPGKLLQQAIGLLLILLSGSAISAMHFHRFDQALPVGTGGILGDWISAPALMLIGEFGATTLYIGVLLTGVPLMLRATWPSLLDTVGSKVIHFFTK